MLTRNNRRDSKIAHETKKRKNLYVINEVCLFIHRGTVSIGTTKRKM